MTDDIPTQVPYVPGKDRRMNYGEMIESMDDMVGRLVAKLDQLGLRENTVIFFTGDNRHRQHTGSHSLRCVDGGGAASMSTRRSR